MTSSVQLTDDQRKHLDYIQAAISRMSGLSMAAKGWGISVSLAAFGFAAAGTAPLAAVVGMTALCFFCLIDCRYLREEQLFRRLYDDARQGLVETYSMDRSAYLKDSTWRPVVRSWSMTGFYLPLTVIGGGSLVWSIAQM